MKLDQLLGQNGVTKADIENTDEYRKMLQSAAPERAFAACILYLRGDFSADAFQGQLGDRAKAVEAALSLALKRAELQRQVASTARQELINNMTVSMRWQPSGPITQPHTNNSFINLILGRGQVNLQDGSAVMNCWEAVILAAMIDRRLTDTNRLAQVYQSSPNAFTAHMVNSFVNGRAHPYQPRGLLSTPIAGDIVFFDDLGHVALATGQVTVGPAFGNDVPGTKIISFWPAPSQPQVNAGAVTTVEVTTVEAIDQYVRNRGSVMKVTFGSPDWNAFS